MSLVVPFLQLIDIQVKNWFLFSLLGFVWALGVVAEYCADISLILFFSVAVLNQKVGVLENFKNIRGVFWSYIYYSFLWGIIVVLGVLAGIIPGIYLGTIFAFVIVISVLDRGKDRSPFKLSRLLVKGNFWVVFFIHLIVLFLTVESPGLLDESDQFSKRMSEFGFGLLGLILVPIYPALMVPLFSKLMAEKEGSGEIAEVRGHRWVGFKAFSGVVGLILLIVVPIVLAFWSFDTFSKDIKKHPIFGKYIFAPFIKYSSPDDEVIFSNGINMEFEWHWNIRKHTEKEEFSGFSIRNEHITEFTLGMIDKAQFQVIPSTANMNYHKYVRRGLALADKAGNQYGLEEPIETNRHDQKIWKHEWFIDEKSYKRHEYSLEANEKIIYCLLSHPIGVTEDDLRDEIMEFEDTFSRISF
ncbi:hypothetical protein BVX98_03860 [bacterium F11]|nr:hypothetical protein BVX98_03860 [bacterium F11]